MLVEPASSTYQACKESPRRANQQLSRKVTEAQAIQDRPQCPSLTALQGPDLQKHPEVELKGLEPLASCMPSMTNPSGTL